MYILCVLSIQNASGSDASLSLVLGVDKISSLSTLCVENHFGFFVVDGSGFASGSSLRFAVVVF